MYTIKLKYGQEEWQVFNDAPLNWKDVKYTLTRSTTFWGISRKVAIDFIFTKDTKAYIDNLIDLYGIDIEIKFELYIYIPQRRVSELLFDGILTFNENTYSRMELQTKCAIEDGSFQQLVMNRKGIEVNYNSEQSIDGDTIVKRATEFESLTLQLSGVDVTTLAVYPFRVFERVVNVLTGKANRFRSTIFANGLGDSYQEVGDMALKMLMSGYWLRQYDATLPSFGVSLEKLFTSFDAMRSLGLGFTTYQGQPCVEVEEKKYFFQKQVVVTIDELSELEFSPIDKLHMNAIEVGFSAQNTNPVGIGQTEYNGKSVYTVPFKNSDKKLSLLSSIRGDGTALQAIYESQADNKESQSTDKDIFVIDSYLEGGNLTSKAAEGFVKVEGIYADEPMYLNLSMTPRRMLNNWGEIIAVSMQNKKDQTIKLQSTSALSKVVTRKSDELNDVSDAADIEFNELPLPYFSGFKAKFSTAITPEVLIAANTNKYGLWKVWNYFKNEYFYGWIWEVSTNPVDKKTNVEIWIAANVEAIEDECIWMAENGSLALAANSSFCLCER